MVELFDLFLEVSHAHNDKTAQSQKTPCVRFQSKNENKMGPSGSKSQKSQRPRKDRHFMKLPPRLMSGEIQRLFDCGQFLSGKTIKMIWCSDPGKPTRISYISPKRLGKANVRNRLRRQIREALVVSGQELPQQCMIGIIAREKLIHSDILQTTSEIHSLMSRLLLEQSSQSLLS